MTYKLISVVGDGVTREWTLDNELVDGNSVLVDGAVVVFTQPAWNRVKMASAPAAGSNVTFKVKELASTDASGSTGGTGSVDTVALASAVAAAVQVPSAAAIATAVAAAVPAAPSASQVATAVSDALSGKSGVVTGQVVQFKEGQVPAGYAQIGGSVSPVVANAFYADNVTGRIGYPGSSAFSRTNDRLFIAGGINSTMMLQEVDASLNPVGTGVAIPSLGSGYTPWLFPTPDGCLLRVGGGTSTYMGSGVTKYNPVSKTWILLPSRTTDANVMAVVGSFAGDGNFYMANNLAVDKFDYVNGVWTYGFDTFPATPIGMSKLPSGKLLVISASAQYVFDVNASSGTRWKQVASVGLVAGSGPVPTSFGARFYSSNVTVNGVSGFIAFYDFNEATEVLTYVVSTVQGPSLANVQRAVLNPYTGAVTLKHATTVGILVHTQTYNPASTVTAVKL